ncbi:alpha/beta fold hydrolase [Pseudohalioglobus sediminis]|uniref:Alpha/beta fold hydrolase n=1 Tax=Pseudohalioglobus sediminis TaxID=2606449 RepID=A0A5B0X459_9GAMM|nr:alpha/beta fold hydrolase [Pseudohalioglobus sediminis]KAA1194096.1 alpha/beta fold hydrolase [Pseudohalioglobus sediminis]
MVAKSLIVHSTAGQGSPIVLLHGLFGNRNNLGALERSLADRYQVFSLDLPNHGRSGWTESLDLATLAAAVGDWMQEQGLDKAAFVGHSLGGKVAMELALATPRQVTALVVADIAPVTYPPHHDAVFAALDAVLAGECRSRQQAAKVMAEHLREQDVIQFLLMSLARGDDGVYRWRFNVDGIKRDYAALRAAPDVTAAYPGPVLLVKGGDSDYIREAHREQVLALFPAAEVKVMPGCGHWLHAQQPDLFNRIVGRFLDDVLLPGERG